MVFRTQVSVVWCGLCRDWLVTNNNLALEAHFGTIRVLRCCAEPLGTASRAGHHSATSQQTRGTWHDAHQDGQPLLGLLPVLILIQATTFVPEIRYLG